MKRQRVNRFRIQVTFPDSFTYRVENLSPRELQADGKEVTLDAVAKACRDVLAMIEQQTKVPHAD